MAAVCAAEASGVMCCEVHLIALSPPSVDLSVVHSMVQGFLLVLFPASFLLPPSSALLSIVDLLLRVELYDELISLTAGATTSGDW